ncbi:MAG: hypothetical protein CVV47_01040 [Spirochaetae bacterium HGW-Spirochaetae-3]|nr:MAG: hypothetical protein CVV47_01040 [Spirochaetae bacterium HGW-Spirochaetae-3]
MISPVLRTVKDTGASSTPKRLAIAVATAAALAALAAAALSGEPSTALRAFFVAPFSNASSILNMVELSAPLALCALGVIVTFRAGHYSLGGEGQAYAGSIAAAAAGYYGYAALGPGATLAAVVAGVLAGAAVAALPAMGRRFAGAEVLLTSILVSQGFIFVIDWAIGGPLRDRSGNLIAMPALETEALLARLEPPSTLTVAPFVVLILCVAASFYFERTRSGAAHDLYGRNPRFAELQGYDVERLSWAPVVASGMLHGLAGALMVLGAKGTAIRGMSGGIGWSAIGAALVAGSRPSAVPLAALLFAWLDSGARQAAVLSDLPPDAGMAIKALVILVVSSRPSWTAVKAFMRRTPTRRAK